MIKYDFCLELFMNRRQWGIVFVWRFLYTYESFSLQVVAIFNEAEKSFDLIAF